MPPAVLEPATPVSDWPHTLALDRSATGIGRFDPRTVPPVANRYTDWTIPARGTEPYIICNVNVEMQRKGISLRRISLLTWLRKLQNTVTELRLVICYLKRTLLTSPDCVRRLNYPFEHLERQLQTETQF